MKGKAINHIEFLFLIIYAIFSCVLIITPFLYNNIIKCIILYAFIILLIIISLKYKHLLNKLCNTKFIFILCIFIGIILRISLIFIDCKELVGIGDYQTFFNNAEYFCAYNTILQKTYVGLFPYLMPYIVILGSFFKIAGVTYKSVVLLNIILDLFIPIFLYFTFKNKSIGKCTAILYLLNPISLVWCLVCCPIILVNFGISLSILIFAVLQRNMKCKKFIILSLLTGFVLAIANSFRPIMVIMLIAIFLYYNYINIKNKKLNLNYLTSFLLILVTFSLTKNGILLVMDKINCESVSRTAGWTLYIGSNLNSNGMWYSEPKLDELILQGLSVEEIQKEFKQLAIERYKSNGIKNISLFTFKFAILTGNVPNYTFSTFSNTISLPSELFFRIIKIILYFYAFTSILLNMLLSIQTFKDKKNIGLKVFYMLFFIGIIISHIFVEVSPRYYMPAIIPLCIINAISIYENIKSKEEVIENDD